jgi:hypothetical protein
MRSGVCGEEKTVCRDSWPAFIREMIARQQVNALPKMTRYSRAMPIASSVASTKQTYF